MAKIIHIGVFKLNILKYLICFLVCSFLISCNKENDITIEDELSKFDIKEVTFDGDVLLSFKSLQDLFDANKLLSELNDNEYHAFLNKHSFISGQKFQNEIERKIEEAKDLNSYQSILNESAEEFNFDETNFGLKNCNRTLKFVLSKGGFVIVDNKLNYFSIDEQTIVSDFSNTTKQFVTEIKNSNISNGIYHFSNEAINIRTACTFDNYIMKESSNRKLRTTVSPARGFQPIGGGQYYYVFSIGIDVLPLKKGVFGWNSYGTDLRHDIDAILKCYLNGSLQATVTFNSHVGYHSSSGQTYVSSTVLSSSTYPNTSQSESYDFTSLTGWSNSTPFDSRLTDGSGDDSGDPNNGCRYNCN